MLPYEAIFAAFPPSVEACGVMLRPATLLHAVALESLGIEIDGNVKPSDVWTAAWVLSLEDPSVAVKDGAAQASAAEFIQAHSSDADCLDEMEKAVNRALGIAMSTFVPGKAADGKQNFGGVPEGFGWPIETAELIAHEHGIPFAEAMRTPCVTAFAIVAMIRARNGGEFGGPDYYERIRLRRIKDAIRADWNGTGQTQGSGGGGGGNGG